MFSLKKLTGLLLNDDKRMQSSDTIETYGYGTSKKRLNVTKY